MDTKTAHSSLFASLVLLASLAPAQAFADATVTDLARDTPISAYAGIVAWSGYDATAKRYRLMLRKRGVTAPARMRSARRAFDVSLGQDSKGRVVALYTRCRTATHGCDVYRYDLRTRRERKLRSVSSSNFDEAWPAQWRTRITFARRARIRVIDGFNHRPDPRRKGPLLACDIPFVKTLTSRRPSRRLDRSQCGSTDGMAIRGETIVHVTGINQGGAGSESQVRRLRARGGAARILARAGGGEGGYSPFTSPSLSASSVWLTRTGQRQGVRQGFLRIELRSRRLTTVPANLNLAGGLARDERGRYWYVEGPPPDFDYHGRPPFCTSALQPCRLVRASASPFSSKPRTLLARLTLDGGDRDTISASATDPPVLSGDLTQTIVRKGAIAGRVPVAGAALALLRTASQQQPGAFTLTGLTATTDQAGRWSFALQQPSPQNAVAVFAPALRIASIVVRVTSAAG